MNAEVDECIEADDQLFIMPIFSAKRMHKNRIAGFLIA